LIFNAGLSAWEQLHRSMMRLLGKRPNAANGLVITHIASFVLWAITTAVFAWVFGLGNPVDATLESWAGLVGKFVGSGWRVFFKKEWQGKKRI